MGETKVEGGTPERANALAEEVVAMMDSIKAIKGEEYADAIVSIFTLNNLVGVLVIGNAHMQAEVGINPEESSIMGIPTPTFINMIVECLAGITAQLATTFVPAYDGGYEYRERLEAKAKEMMADIRMLLKKQDEYNQGGKG